MLNVILLQWYVGVRGKKIAKTRPSPGERVDMRMTVAPAGPCTSLPDHTIGPVDVTLKSLHSAYKNRLRYFKKKTFI